MLIRLRSWQSGVAKLKDSHVNKDLPELFTWDNSNQSGMINNFYIIELRFSLGKNSFTTLVTYAYLYIPKTNSFRQKLFVLANSYNQFVYLFA